MDHYKLVLPEFLNHQGFLFGGYLLKWIDELAYITANLNYPGHRFVTIALDNVTFKHRISSGQILKFSVVESKLGNTSVEYLVQAFGEQDQRKKAQVLFETKITFVSVTESGRKRSIKRNKS
jgi:acyl-CoA hydrolase